jgi:hypothetical protein
MVEKKLNLDIKKSVLEFESIAKKLNLSIKKKKEESIKKKDNTPFLNKNFKRNLSLIERQLLFKKWKNIFNVFLIFSIFMFIVIIFIISSYYKTEAQKQEKIMLEYEDYMSNSVHVTSKLNNSFFYLKDFTGIPEENIQNFMIIENEKCNPNILCKYIGYMQEYDLSTIVNEDFLLDKKVVTCYDNSKCISNFTYLESSKEQFSKQRIKIEKDEENKLKIYDKNNIFIAEIEKKDWEDIEQLYIWFKF